MLEGKDIAMLVIVLALFILIALLWSPPPIERTGETTGFATTVIGSTTPHIPGLAGTTATTTASPTVINNVSIPWILKVKLPKVKPQIGFLQALMNRIKSFFAWLASLFTLPSEQPRNVTTSSSRSREVLLPTAVVASATLAVLSIFIVVVRRRAVKGGGMVVVNKRVRRGGVRDEGRRYSELGTTSPENELVKAIKVLAARLGKVTGRKPDVITHREVLQLVKKHWDELSEDFKVSAVNAVRHYELWRFAGKELRREWLEEARKVMRGAGGENGSTT